MLKIYALSFLSIALLIGCGSSQTREDKMPYHPAAETASIEAKMAAAQSGSSDVAEVKFEKADSKISESEMKKLKDGFTQAQKKHEITHATIAVWSDSEMPKEGDLPDEDVNLAKDRGQALRDQLKILKPGMRAKVINMAEKPGAIKEFLKSESVRIRETLESAGHANAKGSRGIVIFRAKGE